MQITSNDLDHNTGDLDRDLVGDGFTLSRLLGTETGSPPTSWDALSLAHSATPPATSQGYDTPPSSSQSYGTPPATTSSFETGTRDGRGLIDGLLFNKMINWW